jgi:hypothetical protein
MKLYVLAVVLGAIILSGCSPARYIQKSINEYDKVESRVSLGDSKEEVLVLLEPTQRYLKDKSWRKKPDRYTKEGVLVEVYYFRSGLQSDGLTTDDEFTPYIFNDGKLVGIGWAMIGGPKTQGQTTPTTTINVQQKTIVY